MGWSVECVLALLTSKVLVGLTGGMGFSLGKDHWHVLTRTAAVGGGLSVRSRDPYLENALHTHRER